MPKKVTPRLKLKPRYRHFIREWRKFRQLTQKRLAERISMSVGTISQLETGEQGYSQPTLEALAEALNCEPGDLLNRNPLDDTAVWSLNDLLRKAPASQRAQLIAVVEAMLKTGS